MKRSLLALISFVLGVNGAFAADEWRHVGTDARWAVVIRVTEYLESRTGAGLTERHWGERAERWQEKMRGQFGIDPFSEVDKVILYGPDARRGNGVAVVFGRFRHEDALEELSGKSEYERRVFGETVIHSWDSGAVSYPEPGVAVLGRKVESVERALDTLAGRRSRIAPEKLFGPGSTVAAGEFVSAFSEDLSGFGGMPPKAAVLRHAASLRLAAGESEGVLWGDLRLEVPDPEHAEHIENMLRGLVGYARLGEGRGDPFSLLFRHASVTGDDDEIRVVFDVPLSELPF